MLTRCPACQTTFRVSPEQLAARNGRVRCGHCLNAFNALQNGVESPPEAPAPAPEEAAPPDPAVAMAAPPSPPEEDAAPAEDFTMEIVMDEDGAGEEKDEAPPPSAPPAPPPLPAVVHTRANPLATVSFVRLQDEWENAEISPSAAEDLLDDDTAPPHPPEEAPPPLSLAIPDAVAEESTPPTPLPPPAPERITRPADHGQRHLGMAIGCLTAALLVQTAFLFRQNLTQTIPALRPAMVALCDRLGCSLPLPREAELIGIETSDLHPEAGDKGDFVLHATLRNRAGFPQAYPHVELSLTDAGDKALVRRVFSPEEWAPRLSRSEEGFAPGGSAEVSLPFNAAGVAALGYRVYAFYP